MEDDKYKEGYENGRRDADAAWIKSTLKWIVGLISAGFVGAVTILTNMWGK